LVVVFNQLRGMSLIRARESADGFAEPWRVRVVNVQRPSPGKGIGARPDAAILP
jgi:hypothetical protein